MKETIEKYLWKLMRKVDEAYHPAKISWSQQGEDLIIDFVFTWLLGYSKPSYLEIGSNHPFHLSNSYSFYKKGCRGVNIEPSSELIKLLKAKRPGDVNLQVGIGNTEGEMDFFIMSQSTLNTFSKATAQAYTRDPTFGYPKIMDVQKIPVRTANSVLDQYFRNTNNYFLSIDVEGWDYEILTGIDFKKFRPAILCVETNRASGNSIEKYNDLLDNANYRLYADTGINTIFIDDTQLLKK
ncbi:MAG: FkbM family methyltransferase [Flavobacterium sp.]|nr:MAG: FkbM family methyltransferase [Flavobacterium sp.]